MSNSRLSGAPSGLSMRSEARAVRMAGYKFTGTLTRPNVIVPDQNGPGVAFSSSVSLAFLRAWLGSFLLLILLVWFIGLTFL